MSVETEIREAFERHAADVAPSPATWTGIQERIGRRHRLRMAGSVLGAVAAIAAIAVVAPFLLDRDVELPTTPTGWKAVAPTDGGFTLSYPPEWIAGGVDRGVQITPPGPPAGPEGKLSFSLSAYLSDRPYDNPDVTTDAARTEGEIDAHPFVRYERITGHDALNRHVVVYLMPWEGPPIQCPPGESCAQPTYELQISIVARFPDDWDRYAPTAERIVRTVEPMPSQTPPPVPTLQAKIKVQASFLAAGQAAIWAITERSGGEQWVLNKIDPATNRVVGTVDIGIAPVGVAADSKGIWVANGSGCGAVYSCSGAGEGGAPRKPQ